ncbi:MAG: hypothetical protein R2764_16740 [Bacteroidales bacterium]
MKRISIILAFSFILSIGISQTEKYWSGGSETIFGFATIDDDGNSSGSVMRFAPVLNLQGMYNIDLGKNFGFFTGLGLRNVGYIYDNYKTYNDPNDPEDITYVKKKFRTYNLGVPVGLKLGKLDKLFIYGGYEVEYAFNYKEKTFEGGQKTKFVEWFTDRAEPFQHGFLVGIQLPYGSNIKFKYYLSSFHNQDYLDKNTGQKPYENLNTNIFYFSLNYNLFKNANSYKSKTGNKDFH